VSPNQSRSPTAPFPRPIDLRRLPWPTPLARDYCHTYDKLESFYRGSPVTPSQWHNTIEARRASPVNTEALVGILNTQLCARGAPAEALAAAERLGQTDAVAVVTGQQAGLFGGPLFTLFKAVTAIALAQRVEMEHSVKTVPVFWIDAEDHDLDEISSCAVLDSDLELHRIQLDLSSKVGQPLSSVRLTEDIDSILDTLRQTLPRTEFSAEIIQGLATCYSTGTGMVEAFARWLDATLGRHGLVVFDASDSSAKPLVQSIFDKELQLRGETSRLAAAAGVRLSNHGYHAQVKPPDDAIALFKLDGTRRPIRLKGTEFTIGNELINGEALQHQVRMHPEEFSPNVLLRPIVQDTLFPTIAYVPGPNELAYLGQLRQVYKCFGVPMPLIYPRLSATIVDRAAVKFLTRYDVDFETLQASDDGALNQLISAQLPSGIDVAIEDAGKHIVKSLELIAQEAATVDPTLVGATQTTRERMERDLRNLKTKIIQAAKRRDETLRRQFNRTRASLFPTGHSQERSVASIYFLNRYGPNLIKSLLDHLPLEIGQHWLLTI
jgi:bacillithiol biosynthesis cysteine-adding enzyme BshC